MIATITFSQNENEAKKLMKTISDQLIKKNGTLISFEYQFQNSSYKMDNAIIGKLALFANNQYYLEFDNSKIIQIYNGDILKTILKEEQEIQLDNWLKDWLKLLEREEVDKEAAIRRLRSSNPIFIPRNHIIEKVIREASEGNFDQFNQLAKALKEPFTHNSSFVDFYNAPKKEELVQQTFCGT